MKEDFLLYFAAIRQKINRFQRIIFHVKSLTMIILAFWESSLFKPKLQAIEIAIVKKGDFKIVDLKIISGKHF